MVMSATMQLHGVKTPGLRTVLLGCGIALNLLTGCVLDRNPIDPAELPPAPIMGSAGTGGQGGQGAAPAIPQGGMGGAYGDMGAPPPPATSEVDASAGRDAATLPDDASSPHTESPHDGDGAHDAGQLDDAGRWPSIPTPDPMDSGTWPPYPPELDGGCQSGHDAGTDPADGAVDADIRDAGPRFPDPAIPCGSSVCEGPTSYCCIAHPPSRLPSLPQEAFSCQSDPSPDTCVQAFGCSRDEDCGSGRCCGEIFATGALHFTCKQSCGTQDVALGCAGPNDCPDKQFCCGEIGEAGSQYARVSCRTSCLGANERVICQRQADCPAGTAWFNSRACVPSRFITGVSACVLPGQ